MVREGSKEEPDIPTDDEFGCSKLESLITMDERGQMVLPKEIRDKAGIRGGDKLAAITWQKDGQVWCVCLIKADALMELATTALVPMIKDQAKTVRK